MLRDETRQSVIESDEQHAPTWAPGSANAADQARPARPSKAPKSEPHPVQRRQTESRATELRATELRATERRPTELRATERRQTEPRPTEPRATEQRQTEPRPTEPTQTEPRWRTVDRALRQIAGRRAALDAEEARWLREAEQLQIWHPLGLVSALDYVERVLGYAPRTAQERMRVARALGSLPQLDAALSEGTLSHSAVRELTRVMTPATEAKWIAAALGKNLRQIEELVADHREGDDPDDPPDPEARTHVVRFELSAETFALLRQARMVLDDEHGTSLPPEAFISALCNAVLDGAPPSEPRARAKFQIAITTCRRCQQGWQEGAGAQVPIDSAAVERAHCDAQHIGSIDGDAPERASQDVPSSVMRFVWRRDGGRCRADGCRSARGLEVHHIVHRADGGTHDASNCVLLCSACHRAHHRGLLAISGTADHLMVRRRADLGPTTRHGTTKSGPTIKHAPAEASPVADVTANAHVGATKVDAAAMRTQVEGETGRIDRSNAEAMARAHVGATKVDAATMRTQVEGETGRIDRSNAEVIARAHVGATKLDMAILRTQARAALVGLGWKPAIARVAIAAAVAECGNDVTLERLIFESLRRCPVPKA